MGVISVTSDSSGTYAASSSLDSFIRVWNLAEGSTKAVMETPPSETWQIKIHPTAQALTMAAAGGSSHGITIWSCETAEKQQELKIPGVSARSSLANHQDRTVVQPEHSCAGRGLSYMAGPVVYT